MSLIILEVRTNGCRNQDYLSYLLPKLLTGKKAFGEEKLAQYQIILSILHSDLRPSPEKYPMLDNAYDYVWPIMQECWRTSPADRITSKEAHRRLCQAPLRLVQN